MRKRLFRGGGIYLALLDPGTHLTALDDMCYLYIKSEKCDVTFFWYSTPFVWQHFHHPLKERTSRRHKFQAESVSISSTGTFHSGRRSQNRTCLRLLPPSLSGSGRRRRHGSEKDECVLACACSREIHLAAIGS